MKTDLLDEIEGVIVKTLPGDNYRVQFASGHTATVYPCGKMRRAHLRILINDRVMVQLSPYDLTKGRVVWRVRG